jgi:CheY-like chemotaxis protein/two-component sensor histidine kinase
MQIDPREINLIEVQEYLEQTFHPIAEHKSLNFEIEARSDLPRKIFTDKHRLYQILKNLLSNAFKFTEHGRVSMTIEVASKDRQFLFEPLNEACNVIAFTVCDTGIGIPREKQKLIFEAFQQADGTTSRKYGGTGLGLTISRELARLLGGSIEVDSQPNVGSTFTLYLPQNFTGEEQSTRDRLDVDQITLVPPLPKDANFEKTIILVVDDDLRNFYAISSVLEAKRMKVLYAENGKTGLKMLMENPGVHLVLMDVMMPEMDGIEAIQNIRKCSQFEHLPIISLTAKAMKGDREKVIAAGATDYVTKPVDPERLLAVMYYWMPSS